jgi:hypothetical protein
MSEELLPCPLCGVSDPIMNEMPNGAGYLECRSCALRILGRDDYEQSAADAWIELSEKVHGKQYDGPTVEVRIAVVVDDNGDVEAERVRGDSQEAEYDAEYIAAKWLRPTRTTHIVTATLPIPVAQEVKGRVEG